MMMKLAVVCEQKTRLGGGAVEVADLLRAMKEQVK
jgi:hypothetical protein